MNYPNQTNFLTTQWDIEFREQETPDRQTDRQTGQQVFLLNVIFASMLGEATEMLC